jgi:transketolase
MRTIPGMTIINPADAVEARQAVFAAAKIDGPVYLRFGRLAVPVVFDDNYKFEIGKGNLLKEGTDCTIFATGLLVNEALIAAEELKNEGISLEVINIACIKPLDVDLVVASAKKTGCVVTAEEHNIIGGLGAAICETLSENCPTPVIRIGMNDVYGKSGNGALLLKEFGLCSENIKAQVKKAIALK